MTVATGDSGTVEKYAGGYAGVGLDDVDSSDMSMPRLKILHQESLFEDSLTGEQFSSFDAVVLAIVKGRIMWYDKIHDNAAPQCKSNDFKTGFPNLTSTDERDLFPWDKSNFTEANLVINPVNNLPSLPCEKCVLREWPKTQGDKPPCSEQHTYPLLRLDEDGNTNTALLTVSGSSIKNSKAYATAAKLRGEPFFFYQTHVTLIPAKSGTVTYSIVKFSKGQAVDSEDYDMYADQARGLYSLLTQPPRNRIADTEAENMSDNTNAPVVESVAPAATVVTPPPAPPAPPAPVASAEVLPPSTAKRSDLPF